MDYLNYRELYHSGIKGMKWGVRRYQNEDGTLTPAGRSRYSETNAESKRSLGLQRSSKRSDAKTVASVRNRELKGGKAVISGASNAFNNASKAITPRKGKIIYKDYSKMSDAELRTKINRIMMERQYSDLMGETKHRASGSEITKDILSTTGSILGIASSGIGIYLAVKSLKEEK